MLDLHQMAAEARDSFYVLASSSGDARNDALRNMASVLSERAEEVFAANREDMAKAEEGHLAAPLLHRLKFGPEKMNQVVRGLGSLQSLPDPLGTTTLSTELVPGLELYRVTCPIGVVGVIFESRPDALVQIASLCIKSGNAVLLKGGSEAMRTNAALCDCIREALRRSGLPENGVQLLASREDVAAMLKEDELIDLVIPRGSNAFVRYIMDNSRIPVLGHSDGLCHVYIDRDADPETALRVAVDSKTQNVSVCNAAETILVHEDIAPAILPALVRKLQEKGVEVRGDEAVQRIVPCVPASEADWSTEYLDYIVSIKVVPSLQDAVTHINRFGSHHTDAVVTKDRQAAADFLNRVDSAGVYWNVSTRFADGFVYGFGAEVGIATGKIHARGPMGLEGLTTYKYKLLGSGQTMAEMKAQGSPYTHLPLHKADPTSLRKETEK